MITLPKFIGLVEWSDIVVSELSQYGTFNRLTDEKDWKNWAAQFMMSSGLQGKIPQPYAFDDWQEWAERLCQTLE
jgi:hypothetical protein